AGLDSGRQAPGVPGIGGEALGYTERQMRRGQPDTSQREAIDGTASDGTGAEFYRPYYFPPYRTGDWDRWADVLLRAPWLRPALAQAEAQYLFRRVADGMAGQLEFRRSRVDRLRAVGNGVSPLTM